MKSGGPGFARQASIRLPAYDDAVTSVGVASTPRRDLATLAARLYPPMPSSGVLGWLGPVVVMLIGGLLRVWDLSSPNAVAFDETYYPKDAISLLRFGVEMQMVDQANDLLITGTDDWTSIAIFKSDPAFVVHPPLGKWIIATGIWAFGVTPFGWRIAMAILGTLAILITARITRRLTRSDLIGTLAGLLLALDGIHLVMSRTGLLDMALGFWVLVAFGLLLIDRDQMRKRLANICSSGAWSPTHPESPWGPALGMRPLRWAAALALGLACSVKWSGIWFALAFGILTLLWDVSARKVIGVERPWVATLVRSAPSTVVIFLILIIVTYVSSWTGWFLNDNGYARNWAAAQGASVIPDALRSLWHYHAEAWGFHVNLNSTHSYMSNPWSWPLMTRPTSFFWDSIKDGSKGCPTDNCAAEVLALGNPIIWWAAIAAIGYQVWCWVGRRDWRSGAILCGIAAGWLPWFLYLNRTIFTFYTVVYVPFVVMALALTLGALLGSADASPRRRAIGAWSAGILLVLIILASWWFMPIWTGQVLPYPQWQLRMWMPTWI